MQNNIATATTAGAGISMPWWLQFLDPAYHLIGVLLGAVILVFTAWNKILDNRLKRAALRKLEAENGQT